VNDKQAHEQQLTINPFLRVIGIFGLVLVLTFLVCVTVPFYFQGYSDLLARCQFSTVVPAGGLACVHSPPGWIDQTWTRFGLVRFFSYLFSLHFGFTALWLAALALLFGRLSKNQVIDKSFRALALTFVIWTAAEFYKYNAIAYWFE
jgi:hypothetical protein